MIEDILKKHLPELAAIRHDLHAHPEMLFQEERTAKIVAEECRRLGFEVTTGIAKTELGKMELSERAAALEKARAVAKIAIATKKARRALTLEKIV